MRISLELLESFQTLCDTKSYSQTATLLGRSQPAISNRMRTLEKLLGFQLFVGGNPKLGNTPEAEELLEHCICISKKLDQIQAISTLDHERPVRIALTSFIEAFLHVYEIFNTSTEITFPDFSITTQSSDVLEDALLKHAYDTAYVVSKNMSSQSAKRSWPFTVRWLASKDFVLDEHLKNDAVPIVEFTGEECAPGLDRPYLESLEFETKPVFQTECIRTYLSAVSAGVGIGCIGDIFVAHALKDRNLVFLDKQFGDLGRFFLNRICADDQPSDTHSIVRVFDIAIDNQHKIIRGSV